MLDLGRVRTSSSLLRRWLFHHPTYSGGELDLLQGCAKVREEPLNSANVHTGMTSRDRIENVDKTDPTQHRPE